MTEDDRSRRRDDEGIERGRRELSGMRARRRLRDVPGRRLRELVERSLDLGLTATPSVNDRDISLFSRSLDPMFAGITTFLESPYVEDVRDIVRYVAVPVAVGSGRAHRPAGSRAGLSRRVE